MHFRRRWFAEVRKLAGEFVHRQHCRHCAGARTQLAPPQAADAQRSPHQWLQSKAQHRGNCLKFPAQWLGPCGTQRLPPAPSQSVGFAEEVGCFCRANEAFLALPVVYAVGKCGYEGYGLAVVAFDVGAKGVKLVMRPAGENNGQTIIGATGNESTPFA